MTGPSAARTAAVGAVEWAKMSYELVRTDGLSGVAESARTFRTGLWRLAGLVYNYGVPIYELEWDVLVVLDGCRADLMADVAPSYDFIEFDTVDSVASASPEWMEKNFTSDYTEELAATAYVTANPYSRTHCDSDEFLLVDEVWDDGWDDSLGTVPADVVTNRAIAVAREQSPPRLIVHYMQPHHPFVPTPLDDGMDRSAGRGSFGQDGSVWQRLREGEFTHEEVWSAYRENLEYVLEHVGALLAHIDAERVAITADHGNAFGERGIYGHPIYVPIRPLKRVPWCVTSARARDGAPRRDRDVEQADAGDEQTTPGDGPAQDEEEGRDGDVDAEVERKLRDLGYL